MSWYKLYCGDCLEIMPTLEAWSIDAVITDPPYPNKSGIFDDMQHASILAFKYLRVLCPGIQLWFWDNDSTLPCSRQPIRHKWHKTNGWQVGNTESILEYSDNQSLPKDYYYPNVNVGESVPERYKLGNHPTPKPIKLMAKIIVDFTNPGDTILDPFMGSGTTGVACMQLGRNFIGIEIDPGYFAIAEKRIHQASLQPQLFTTQEERQPQPTQAGMEGLV